MTPLEQYIRQAASARGINPDVAVRVASSEGGLRDPYRKGVGPAPKSQLSSYGPRENSFGPFQLYISGTNSGLGDKALATGIDPRKNWQAGVDFALDQAKQGGWGPWYGAKAAGITGMMGIGSGGSSLPGKIGGDSMVARNFDPEVAAQTNTPSIFGSIAPSGPSNAPLNIPDSVIADATRTGKEKTFGDRLDGLAKTFDDAIPKVPRPSAFPGGPSQQQANAINEFLKSPNAFARMLLGRRMG